jgi:glycosyltransferase involved in cell wall biosynthesis
MLHIAPRETGQVVGFIGRLERRKGIETFIEAIPRIIKRIPQVRFRLIGGIGTHSRSHLSYSDWAKDRLGLHKDKVEFVGTLPLHEMASAYKSVDVCVFPSVWENFPNVCLEAMSAGRAIVASESGGMREMLQNGEVGKLIRPKDPVGLAAATIQLLLNGSERERLGRLARERLLAAYNTDVIGELMEQIFSDAILYKRHRIC